MLWKVSVLACSLLRGGPWCGVGDEAQRGLNRHHFDDRMQKVLGGLAMEGLDGCQRACALLSELVPEEVTAQGRPGYQPLAYWSAQQTEVTPSCRIDVESANSIATVINVSRLTECPFAVRGGGHAAFAGGSSIKNGILLNMGRMNEVQLSEDRTTVSVGPGNNWHDVYTKLDPMGLSVVGGREAGVGVGGLTLGGGISYFSGRYGWACDNVRNYEVVLADGRIVNASPNSHPDLYWALRGGSGTNFGVVSRFDLATFEQGKLWGGSRYHAMSTNASLADALTNFNKAAPSDPFAHLYVAFVYAQGNYLAVSGPVHGKPEPNPPIFDELAAVPSMMDALSVASTATLSVELNQTEYLRQTFRTATIRNDPALLKKIIAIFVEETQPLVATVAGLLPAFAFQPIPLNTLAQMSQNGGNALGLASEKEPLLIMNLNFGWSNPSDDAVVHAATARFVRRSVALAREMGAHHPFVYMNYASPEAGTGAGSEAAVDSNDDDAPTKGDDPFTSYGPVSRRRLEKVRARYDPEGVLRRLQPGYFKL